MQDLKIYMLAEDLPMSEHRGVFLVYDICLRADTVPFFGFVLRAGACLRVNTEAFFGV